MKSSSLAIVLSTLSLASVGLLYVKVGEIGDKLELRESYPEARRGAGVAASEVRTPPREAWIAPAAAEAAGESAAPERRTLEERVAGLERERDRYREELTQARKATAGARPWSSTHRRTFARNMDQLAETLKLTSTQRARVQDAIDRGKRLVEEVMKIPDETGKSPDERREEHRKKIREAFQRGGTAILPVMSNLLSYRNRKIPGRSETYGQEIDRIKKETRGEVVSALNREQQEAFQNTSIDPLLGGGGPMTFVATSFRGGEGGEEVGIVVEGAAVIEETIEVEGSGAPGKEAPPAGEGG